MIMDSGSAKKNIKPLTQREVVMKILVATKEGQGKRKNDFMWCNENELVRFGSECDGEKVDGRCGCKRSLVGMANHRATTTFKVIEINIHPMNLLESIKQSLVDSGWAKYMEKEELNKLAREDMKYIIELANSFTPGKVIERRGKNYQTR